MAKDRIEEPPDLTKKFKHLELGKFSEFLFKYQAVDEKGRYLHWNEFKWRVSPNDDPEKAWYAVKFNRSLMLKELSLYDKKRQPFKFCIPDSLQSKLYQIVKLAGSNVGAIANTKAGSHIQNNFLVSSLLMEEAISSAQLEGANTTRRIAKEMLESDRAPMNEDERMIVNNYLLMKEANRRCQEPLSTDLILDFHRIATAGTTKNHVVPGEFRKDNDAYIADGLEGNIVHQPPESKDIPDRMQNLCEFANSSHDREDSPVFIEPAVKAVILHFMIGYDHPFADGNGRTARALFYWFLLKNSYQLFEYIPISKLLKNSPTQYGAAYLRTETDENDLTYFLYHQVDVIIKAIGEFTDYLERRAAGYYEVLTWLEHAQINAVLNFVQREIIRKAVKSPGRIFTAKEIRHDFDVSENTARSYLNQLADLKLLLVSKEGRTMQYIAPANLRERIK
ncbi:MAG TPA: Fic family protein [Candidatus Rifleibacterium sp.]|nr:Fic family protein [Candidatus Rifleibacterium sp.]HPT47016.1 Fic family protein [Candidatus Rifleibacterium sp.]